MPLTLRQMIDGQQAAIMAYGTSEGAEKGWENRSHTYKGGKAAEVHQVLRQHGFTQKGFKDFGQGRGTITQARYEHPDGHTATLSRSSGWTLRGNDFVNVGSKDAEFHEKLEKDLVDKKLIGVSQYPGYLRKK